MHFNVHEEYTIENIKLFAKSNGYRFIVEETPCCDMFWHYEIAPPYIHVFDKDILIYRFEQHTKDWKCMSNKHI